MLDDKNNHATTELVSNNRRELFNPTSAIKGIKADQENIVQDIISASDGKDLQKHIDAFNLSQTKKNALRIIRLNDILDRVEDQVNERVTQRPDEISNRELIEYMQAVSNQLDKSQKSLSDTLDEKKPLIQINTQNNDNSTNVNVGPKLSRESREKVVDVVSQLLKSINKPNINIEESIINSDNAVIADYTMSDLDDNLESDN